MVRVGPSTIADSAQKIKHPQQNQSPTFPHVFYATLEDLNRSSGTGERVNCVYSALFN